MTHKEQYTKQRKNKERFKVLRSFMSSLTLTAVAVIAVAVAIPRSPKASIQNVKVFEHEIAYQIIVTDLDQALDLDSLKVVLEGQLETYEQPLYLGLNVGLFENLRPSTAYHLQIFGSKGFGSERLASMRVKTSASSNGAIVSYELVEHIDYYLNYEVRILLNDSEQKYESVSLYYTYLYPDEEAQNYEQIVITSADQIVFLADVPNEHTRVHLYLEAVHYDGEINRLDELMFHVPFQLSTFVYLEQRSASTLAFQFYGDYYITNQILYSAKLYLGYMLIDHITVEGQQEYTHHDSATFTFLKLKKNTEYRLVISATYIHPQTMREETIMLHEETYQTLGDYEIEYDIRFHETHIEVYIQLNDPNHYFQVPFYVIYEVVEHQMIYYESNTFDFTPDGVYKFVTFEILYPDVETYQILIAVRNQNDYTMYHILVQQNRNN